jgi:hypothetical protein
MPEQSNVPDVQQHHARAASILNAELTQLVVESGQRMGFSVQTEYPISGGRLDAVWSIKPSSPIPHFDGALPIVAFEIESSWRSRKHVKGSLLNLQDCGVSLGIIVLAGITKEVDSLRRFARELVDRPGLKVLIWTEDDVRLLALGKSVTDLPISIVDDYESLAAERYHSPKDHRGKHRLLCEWLLGQERRPMTLTFADVEGILGAKLPESCRTHAPNWYSYQGSAIARAIIDAGWRARQVHVNAGTVTLIPQEDLSA